MARTVAEVPWSKGERWESAGRQLALFRATDGGPERKATVTELGATGTPARQPSAVLFVRTGDENALRQAAELLADGLVDLPAS